MPTLVFYKKDKIMSTKKLHAQPPKKLTGIEFEKIPSSAAGFPAIKSAITQIKDKVGLKKGIGLLLSLIHI